MCPVEGSHTMPTQAHKGIESMLAVKNVRRLASFIATLLLLAATATPVQARWEWATGPSVYDEDGRRDWNVEIVPYLWLSSIDGTLGLPATGTIPVSATFDSLASNLDAGFAGLLDLRWRRWHLVSDNSWVSLGTQVAPPQGPITSSKLDSSVAFGTVGVAYELPLKKSFALDAYLAARWWHVSNDAVIDTAGPGGPFSDTLTETWADAILGARIRYRITKSWRVSAVADVGAGAANIDWSLFGSVGYDFNDHVGVTAGYRVLGVDYANRGFVYDIKQHGLLLGLNLRY
jgi:hypothetical protein